MSHRKREHGNGTLRHRLKRKATPPEEESAKYLFSVYAKAFLLTVLIGTGLLSATAVGLSFTENPGEWIWASGLICAALTAFLGGWVAIRLRKKKGLLTGLTAGLLLSALTVLLSFAVKSNRSDYSVWQALALHAGFLAFSMAGALLGQKSLR